MESNNVCSGYIATYYWYLNFQEKKSTAFLELSVFQVSMFELSNTANLTYSELLTYQTNMVTGSMHQKLYEANGVLRSPQEGIEVVDSG